MLSAFGKENFLADERIEKKSPPTKILLVDDHEPIQLLVSAFLKKWPYLIDVADNGRDGVEKYESGDYDVVLMDIQMPVMNGVEATRGIRELEKRQGKKPAAIVAVSARCMKDDVEKMMEAGCTDFLAKPIDKERLLQTIAQTSPKPDPYTLQERMAN